jgi:hypothetical protein
MKVYEDFARNLTTKELAVASCQHIDSHFLFHHRILDKKQHDCHPQPPYSPDLAPCNFTVSPIEDKTEMLPF